MKRTAPINALQSPDRSQTTLIYLDAVEPRSTKAPAGQSPGNGLPGHHRTELSRLRRASQVEPAKQDEPEPHTLTLPVTTPRRRFRALFRRASPSVQYQRNDDYSATEPRERYLWLEFEEPVRDPNDSYFIRVLGYSADPLLSDNRPGNFVPPDEPPLDIDPELIRVITPGQSDDQAGLSAMLPLEQASNSDRHYLVPLPPGLHAESNELFGFFTYELRVGHADIWSTAQGRFGRPLRTTGVQHPVPTLFCTAHRDEVRLLVEAPHAMAVLNGKNITAHPPRTELWALLYAQVRQADGKDNRNILLDERQLSLIPNRLQELLTAEGTFVLTQGNKNAPARSAMVWHDAEIKALLKALGLPVDASLSVLCVEMMPHFGSFQQEAQPTATYGMQGVNAEVVLAGVRAARGNVTDAATGATFAQQNPLRPLSTQLGHFRILRTSPLTPVPDVC